MTQEIESGPIDMEGLTPLQQGIRRANRCQMEFVQANLEHRCWMAAGHQGYHYVNEWGILYWAHPLQKFGQATEEFMAQISRGECIMLRAADQTEEDMRKLPYMEMDYSVPCVLKKEE
jgi:hypothetical protein